MFKQPVDLMHQGLRTRDLSQAGNVLRLLSYCLCWGITHPGLAAIEVAFYSHLC